MFQDLAPCFMLSVKITHNRLKLAISIPAIPVNSAALMW